MIAASAFAQSAREIRGPTPLVAIQNEPPAKLIVDPPIPEQLALGRVMIQYRTENLRILPVFGSGALSVSPRVGHVHYYSASRWASRALKKRVHPRVPTASQPNEDRMNRPQIASFVQAVRA